MRKDDSVFFFTLVDFLLTALFFGLVLFAVGKARAQRQEKAAKDLARMAENMRRATGVSDLTELTDRLTRLGPIRDAEESVRLVANAGGREEAAKAIAAVVKAGGSDTVTARLERLAKREGVGLPHCLLIDPRRPTDPRVLARVVADDSTIAFAEETPQLRAVLDSIGLSFSEVRSMRLKESGRVFMRLRRFHPGCRYTIDFTEHTRFVDARDAMRGTVYMRIHR